MTNKLILFVLLFVTSCTMAVAQQAAPLVYTVKGILVDSLTQEPEPYATVRIVNKANPEKPVKMAITDNKGQFQEKISGTGDYRLTISSIGKTTVTKEFVLKPELKTVDLGTLYTADASNELGVVEVVAQKPLVKVDLDKIEYNIEDDPDSQTNSVLEMLRKVPLVTVDGEDKIQVNGSSSFKVHVNGKPNNMMSDNPTEVLKSMPANSIKHIEVITNPGAKYDAEGVGGILNIVTVGSGLEGYTATFGANATNTGGGGNIYATVKKDKFTVTGSYSYSYNKRPKSYSYGERENYNDQTIEVSDGWTNNKGAFQHGNVEASYELDTLRLFSLSFGIYGSNDDSNGETDIHRLPIGTTSDDNYLYKYRQLNNGENSWFSIRGGFDYQRLFKVKDRMLTFSYRISSRPRTSDNYLNYDYTSGGVSEGWADYRRFNQHRDSEQSTTEHTFQGDYVTPIGKYHSIEAGVKYIIRNNKSDDDLFLQDASGDYKHDMRHSSHYKHLNDILAAYTGYSVKYKSFMGKAGLRYERTMQNVKYDEQSDYENFKVNFNDVVPSASVGMKMGDTKNLRLSYDMRIWRPSIYFLNPYIDNSTPGFVYQGNSQLESEKSHRFQLSFSSFTSKFNFNIGLRHSFTNNSIESVTDLRAPSDIPGLEGAASDKSIYYSTYANIGKSKNTNLSLYANWNITSNTRAYINADGGYSALEGGSDVRDISKNLSNNGWNLFLYGGIQHTFPKDIRVGFNLMGGTPYIQLQGRGSGFYSYDININKSFLDKRLTLSAFANNIFTKYVTYKSVTEGEGFKTSSNYKYPHQRFGVSISYRIGELKASVKKASRAANNDDEKGGGSNQN